MVALKCDFDHGWVDIFSKKCKRFDSQLVSQLHEMDERIHSGQKMWLSGMVEGKKKDLRDLRFKKKSPTALALLCSS